MKKSKPRVKKVKPTGERMLETVVWRSKIHWLRHWNLDSRLLDDAIYRLQAETQDRVLQVFQLDGKWGILYESLHLILTKESEHMPNMQLGSQQHWKETARRDDAPRMAGDE